MDALWDLPEKHQLVPFERVSGWFSDASSGETSKLSHRLNFWFRIYIYIPPLSAKLEYIAHVRKGTQELIRVLQTTRDGFIVLRARAAKCFRSEKAKRASPTKAVSYTHLTLPTKA